MIFSTRFTFVTLPFTFFSHEFIDYLDLGSIFDRFIWPDE